MEITLGNAKRALDASEAIKDRLLKNIDPYEAFGLSIDEWTGSSKHHPDGDV